MRIGKNGLSDNVIKEIKRQLNDKGEVKIKFLKNIVRNKEDFEKLVSTLLSMLEGVTLVKKVGHTIVLKKIVKKPKGRKQHKSL